MGLSLALSGSAFMVGLITLAFAIGGILAIAKGFTALGIALIAFGAITVLAYEGLVNKSADIGVERLMEVKLAPLFLKLVVEHEARASIKDSNWPPDIPQIGMVLFKNTRGQSSTNELIQSLDNIQYFSVDSTRPFDQSVLKSGDWGIYWNIDSRTGDTSWSKFVVETNGAIPNSVLESGVSTDIGKVKSGHYMKETTGLYVVRL